MFKYGLGVSVLYMNDLKWPKMTLGDFLNDLKWSKMTQNDLKWFLKWLKMTQSDLDLEAIVRKLINLCAPHCKVKVSGVIRDAWLPTDPYNIQPKRGYFSDICFVTHSSQYLCMMRTSRLPSCTVALHESDYMGFLGKKKIPVGSVLYFAQNF